ncbi:hypothetical protein ACP4OV_013134 [Aristida adscensionis]
MYRKPDDSKLKAVTIMGSQLPSAGDLCGWTMDDYKGGLVQNCL